MEATYSIVRFFFDAPNETLETGLTLDEAQTRCNDPETSSTTAEQGEAPYGMPWFDGYTEE